MQRLFPAETWQMDKYGGIFYVGISVGTDLGSIDEHSGSI